MTFFELFDQFFQLNDQQPIKPLASKLYMYWLHGFNKARWPVLLHRRANQVFTDLGCDKNTLATAVSQLERRGLLAYDAGKNGVAGQWYLNYEPATPGWAIEVKNSPQATTSEVKNSPSPAGSEVNFSPPNPAQAGGEDNSRVKNSPPIRNRQDNVLEKDQPTPSASVRVGEAAEEITLAPLPTELSALVPPVAEPPHAAESRPVAAAELPAALMAEAKALASTIALLWHVSELKNYTKWARVAAFTHRLAQLGRLDEVKLQHGAYSQQRQCAGIRPHALDTYLGTPARDYQDGEWCGCDWVAVAADTRPRGSQAGQAPAPTRATTSHQKTAAQSWS